jgi:hypothetical protein
MLTENGVDKGKCVTDNAELSPLRSWVRHRVRKLRCNLPALPTLLKPLTRIKEVLQLVIIAKATLPYWSRSTSTSTAPKVWPDGSFEGLDKNIKVGMVSGNAKHGKA